MRPVLHTSVWVYRFNQKNAWPCLSEWVPLNLSMTLKDKRSEKKGHSFCLQSWGIDAKVSFSSWAGVYPSDSLASQTFGVVVNHQLYLVQCRLWGFLASTIKVPGSPSQSHSLNTFEVPVFSEDPWLTQHSTMISEGPQLVAFCFL